MVMSEYVIRFLSMIFEILIPLAMRLTRAAGIRTEIESYTALFEEARALEQGGQAKLAQHLRREVDAILEDSTFAAGVPALKGDQGPFALESRPTSAGTEAMTEEGVTTPEGEGSQPRRRRGRPRGSKNVTPPTEEEAVEPADDSPEEPREEERAPWPESA